MCMSVPTVRKNGIMLGLNHMVKAAKNMTYLTNIACVLERAYAPMIVSTMLIAVPTPM